MFFNFLHDKTEYLGLMTDLTVFFFKSGFNLKILHTLSTNSNLLHPVSLETLKIPVQFPLNKSSIVLHNLYAEIGLKKIFSHPYI